MAPAPTELVWFRDPGGFFSDDRLAHFLPERNTTLAVQLNALLRLSIYSSVVMVLFRRYSMAVYVPITTAALTYAIYVSNTPASGVALHEGLTREGSSCTAPTRMNPFMNTPLSAYMTDPQRAPACDLSSPGTSQQVDSFFKENLYRDVDDVFSRRASSHAFYTMPNTQIPNDQGGFAQWCYGTGPTFKEGALSAQWRPNLQSDLHLGTSGLASSKL